MEIFSGEEHDDTDRAEQFREFAQRVSRGDVLTNPAHLPPMERRLYVRATIREDHQFRIQSRPEGAQEKFDKLARSAWHFYRGTALLFYRDIAGTDGHLPVVLVIGDAHPENFGVMPNEDGVPFFGVNDFDEAAFAPFSWELKRASVGFYLAMREVGRSRKKARKAVKAFLDGYFDGLLEFARSDREKWHEFRLDNSPPLIRKLLKSSRDDREEFLAELVDLKRSVFRSSDEIVPHSKYVEDFQGIIDRYRSSNRIPETRRTGHFRVKDVAIKKGSGTASLGLDRYFVLIDGPSDNNDDDIVLELKQTRRSALDGLVPEPGNGRKHGPDDADEPAGRIVSSHSIHLVGGDPYYGQTEIDDQSFLVRERSPCKNDFDIDDLSYSEFKCYADICGRTLSIAHARCDGDTGLMEGDAEKKILASVHRPLFIGDMIRFAEVTAKRIRRDFKEYQRDHAAGAFDFTHTAS